MREITVLTDIPEPDFEVERYEYRPYKKNDICYDLNGWGESLHSSEDYNGHPFPFLIAIPKKKYEYPWPEYFADGTKLTLILEGLWRFSYQADWNYLMNLKQFIPSLPEPPSDAPVGTVFIKGGAK